MKVETKNIILEDYFVISVDCLEISDSKDFEYELYQLEYCETSLDIPLHMIDYTSFDGEEFEICLKQVYAGNIDEDSDWYFHLKDLARYSRAS